jgi:hypothetical protein
LHCCSPWIDETSSTKHGAAMPHHNRRSSQIWFFFPHQSDR